MRRWPPSRTRSPRRSPATNKGHRATVDPLRERLASQELRLTSLLLLGVVAFVLLMCCANVANLLLARTSARARELAMRSALGAGRLRIVRQLLTESLVLAGLGGVFGIAVGATILKAAPSIVPPGLLPQSVPLAFDQRVLVFSVATTSVIAILYGLAPAWQATSMSLVHIMSLDTRTATGGSSKLRKGLAIAEVAVAVLLLCGAGLLLRTLLTLEDVDPGNRASELLTTAVSPGVGADGRMRCGGSMRLSSARCVPCPACATSPGGARCRSTGSSSDRRFRSTATRRGRRPIATARPIRS